MMKGLSISQVAEQSGVGKEALRYYETQGLISATRTESGFRSFEPSVVGRLRFIKRGQQLGFSLREVAELLALEEQPDHTSAEVREIAVKKLKEIEEKLQELLRLKTVLSDLTSRCSGKGALADCPIIESLRV